MSFCSCVVCVWANYQLCTHVLLSFLGLIFLYSWQVAGTWDPPEKLAWLPGRRNTRNRHPYLLGTLCSEQKEETYSMDSTVRLPSIHTKGARWSSVEYCDICTKREDNQEQRHIFILFDCASNFHVMYMTKMKSDLMLCFYTLNTSDFKKLW